MHRIGLPQLPEDRQRALDLLRLLHSEASESLIDEVRSDFEGNPPSSSSEAGERIRSFIVCQAIETAELSARAYLDVRNDHGMPDGVFGALMRWAHEQAAAEWEKFYRDLQPTCSESARAGLLDARTAISDAITRDLPDIFARYRRAATEREKTLLLLRNVYSNGITSSDPQVDPVDERAMAWLHQPDYRSVELPRFESFESMFEESVESMGTSVVELELAAIARVSSGHPMRDDARGVIHADLMSEPEDEDKLSDSAGVNAPPVRPRSGGVGSRSIGNEAVAQVVWTFFAESHWSLEELSGPLGLSVPKTREFLETGVLSRKKFDKVAAKFGLRREELLVGKAPTKRPTLIS